MASQTALAIRRNDAYQRIEQATKKLAKTMKVEHSSPLDIRHRDPMVEQVQRVESVADTIEALIKAADSHNKDDDAQISDLESQIVDLQAQLDALQSNDAQPPTTIETVPEKPLETVETVEIVKDDAKPKGKGK